jgi:hypothetical protein
METGDGLVAAGPEFTCVCWKADRPAKRSPASARTAVPAVSTDIRAALAGPATPGNPGGPGGRCRHPRIAAPSGSTCALSRDAALRGGAKASRREQAMTPVPGRRHRVPRPGRLAPGDGVGRRRRTAMHPSMPMARHACGASDGDGSPGRQPSARGFSGPSPQSPCHQSELGHVSGRTQRAAGTAPGPPPRGPIRGSRTR